jgi:hypothetical protein
MTGGQHASAANIILDSISEAQSIHPDKRPQTIPLINYIFEITAFFV